MFGIDEEDEVFAAEPQEREDRTEPPPIRLKKTIGQQLMFWGANAFVLSLVGLVYQIVIADGFRKVLPIFQLRLYKMPVPGAGLLRLYDGWDRLDLSMVMALILFIAVTYIWIRIFNELQQFGAITQQRLQNPIYFYLLLAIVSLIVIGDAGLFYIGVSSQVNTGWGSAPAWVPAVATLAYMAGLALIGAWHADYANSGKI